MNDHTVRISSTDSEFRDTLKSPSRTLAVKGLRHKGTKQALITSYIWTPHFIMDRCHCQMTPTVYLYLTSPF